MFGDPSVSVFDGYEGFGLVVACPVAVADPAALVWGGPGRFGLGTGDGPMGAVKCDDGWCALVGAVPSAGDGGQGDVSEAGGRGAGPECGKDAGDRPVGSDAVGDVGNGPEVFLVLFTHAPSPRPRAVQTATMHAF